MSADFFTIRTLFANILCTCTKVWSIGIPLTDRLCEYMFHQVIGRKSIFALPNRPLKYWPINLRFIRKLFKSIFLLLRFKVLFAVFTEAPPGLYACGTI